MSYSFAGVNLKFSFLLDAKRSRLIFSLWASCSLDKVWLQSFYHWIKFQFHENTVESYDNLLNIPWFWIRWHFVFNHWIACIMSLIRCIWFRLTCSSKNGFKLCWPRHECVQADRRHQGSDACVSFSLSEKFVDFTDRSTSHKNRFGTRKTTLTFRSSGFKSLSQTS